ncbi:helix-turn-helix transcriptional regulator [Enterococcus caccae]|uniref:HTH deoR-type domain-containing protein n=1 Tax=Enterococcus caccae ATCC BAA-1240 TaxID=1158612 RepID=R3WDR2_9ENTE|nr:YafY family protein [Enterococcus caccae]EOL45976.1 hypothetical protein UC7_01773 [Enterococcus caccae ATCC BAA-1240]EOT61172.1 hypothetical protein I580_02074 [Enterococcus caccae ATCC BAA-1240]OJG27798.1 hypothetical protein RU98_GL002007 [Enterococcus caccae]
MKTERLLAITMILLEKKQISASQLAERLEVSVRTIYRDIHSLSEAGIPVTSSPGVNGGIQIMDNYKIDKHFFTSTDLTSLLIALEGFSNNVSPIQLNQTFEKVKTLIPIASLDEIKFKTNQIAIDLTPWTSNHTLQPSLEIAKSGMDQDRLLRFNYEDNHGRKTVRIVEPYRLVLKEISWYLQAFCTEKTDFRIFKISRMTNLELLSATFTPREFHPAPLGKQPFYGKDFTTTMLKVTPKIKEQLVDKFGQLTLFPSDDPEKFIVAFPFMEDEFGYNLFLGFGNQCECLAPPHVRAELKRRIENVLALYQTP